MGKTRKSLTIGASEFSSLCHLKVEANLETIRSAIYSGLQELNSGQDLPKEDLFRDVIFHQDLDKHIESSDKMSPGLYTILDFVKTPNKKKSATEAEKIMKRAEVLDLLLE